MLGITIDDKLSFNTHVSNLCKKAARQLNVLCRLSNLLDEKTKLIIYKAYIFSNFNYCPLVWHFCSKTSTNKMEKIQQRALKFVFGVPKGQNKTQTYSYHQLLNKANLVPLTVFRLRALAKQVFMSINKIGPSYLHDLFRPKIHRRTLRKVGQLDIPQVKTVKFGVNSLRHLGPKIWNDLPNEFKKDLTLTDFNRLICSWDGPKCNCGFCSNYD